ncbi:MAG: hypothetical protein WKF73_15700 [Nocardioidaceae bacterium]
MRSAGQSAATPDAPAPVLAEQQPPAIPTVMGNDAQRSPVAPSKGDRNTGNTVSGEEQSPSKGNARFWYGLWVAAASLFIILGVMLREIGTFLGRVENAGARAYDPSVFTGLTLKLSDISDILAAAGKDGLWQKANDSGAELLVNLHLKIDIVFAIVLGGLLFGAFRAVAGKIRGRAFSVGDSPFFMCSLTWPRPCSRFSASDAISVSRADVTSALPPRTPPSSTFCQARNGCCCWLTCSPWSPCG